VVILGMKIYAPKRIFKRLGWGKYFSRGWDGENIFQEVGMGKIFFKRLGWGKYFSRGWDGENIL